MSPKILLLQARHRDDPMAEHEWKCFVTSTELAEENVVVHDLCTGPPALEILSEYDAMMIGGSGDFYVSRANLPHNGRFFDLLRELVDRSFPLFASCFGYQSMVEALGGEIVHDPDNTEVGTYELRLTPEASEDPLFGALPKTFRAQMGHKDRAARHPEGLANLSESVLCPLQAFRIPNKPIWASQFHPELDCTTNRERYRHYLDGYAGYMSAEQQEEALSRFEESPEASGLLKQFLDVVFG